MIDNTKQNSTIQNASDEDFDMTLAQATELDATELFAEPVESDDSINEILEAYSVPNEDNFAGIDDKASQTLGAIEAELSVLRHAVKSFNDADGLPVGSLDEIEAELLALRQMVESIDNPKAEVYDPLFEPEDIDAPKPELEISSEQSEQSVQPEIPIITQPETLPEAAAAPQADIPAEPAEMDSYATLAAELFEQADSGDFGVNSQNFNPEDYDVASQTACISSNHLDESEMETIDVADLEALFDLGDAPPVANNHGFLADAARVEEEENESVSADIMESDDQIDFSDQDLEQGEELNPLIDETDWLQADDETQPESHQADFSLDDDTPDVAIHVDQAVDDVVADEAVSDIGQPETLGLDLQDDGGDPMDWFNKIKNEMSSKFNIDIDATAPVQAASPLEQTHEQEISLELEDELMNEINSLEASPSFTEAEVQTHHTSLETPVDAMASIELDDILAEETLRQVNLTADPLDDEELEIFDESLLLAGDPMANASHDVFTEVELDLDLSVDADVLDEAEAAVSDDQAVAQTSELVSDMTSDTSAEPLPTVLDVEKVIQDDASRQPEVYAPVVADSDDVFEQDIDFSDIIDDLPAESLQEIPITGMDELDVISTEIAQMQELELSEPFSADEAGALTIDEAVQLTSEQVSESSEPTEPSNDHSWKQDVAHAIKDKAEEIEIRAEMVANDVSDALKQAEEWLENMGEVIGDKAQELEMRAEMVAHDVLESVNLSDELPVDSLELAEEISADELDALLMGEDLVSDEIFVPTETQPDQLDDAAVESLPESTVLEAVSDVQAAVEPEHRQPENHLTDTDTTIQEAMVIPTVAALSPEEQELDKRGWAERLKQGLSKSRNQMAKSLAGVFGGGKIDEDLYEELETTLLISDMGIEATEQLMKEVRNRVSLKGLKDGAQLRSALKEAVYDLLKPLEKPLEIPDNGQPFVIMMAGINGAGKTTSIGKLAKYFQGQGKSVMLAAGDTFRAAAREQLQEWGARNNVTVISQVSGDSAAVCFDAVESAKAKKIDVVLADTAGRLPTQLHLMEEIKKVKRVLQKSMPDAPHEIMMVLDANIGQNAINQVVAFDSALDITGLIVTKLDGTAKGGVLAALASNHPIPVRYIGVGEGIDDLRPFNARAFVDALLDE